MTLFLNGKPLVIDSEAGQRALTAAHGAGTRVECQCRMPAPEIYIAATAGKFIVKRMPGTGPDHAIDCPSFLPPEELSGLAQVQASAITEDPDDGTTTLKLGFPLRKNSKSRTAPEQTGATPFGLVIAEYKGMEATAHDARFVFKHAPDCAFFADAELAQKFEKVFGDQLRFLEAMGSGHAILIASFSIAKAGYPVLQEIGMMLVTENWIPFEGMRELEVLSALTEQSRAFQKQLRFNLPVDAPIASAVLLDTTDPIAVFVADNPDDAGALALLTEASEEGRYASWCWFDDGPMSPFPDRGASPSSHHSRPPEGGAAGHSVRPSPANERRASGDERDTMWDSPILPNGASDHG